MIKPMLEAFHEFVPQAVERTKFLKLLFPAIAHPNPRAFLIQFLFLSSFIFSISIRSIYLESKRERWNTMFRYFVYSFSEWQFIYLPLLPSPLVRFFASYPQIE
jgi:hypothetical protein